MIDTLLNRPLFTLTVSEFLNLKSSEPIPQQVTIVKDSTPVHLHSLKDLANFLDCSVVTAQKLKNSGKIRYKQFGRKVPEHIGSRQLN